HRAKTSSVSAANGAADFPRPYLSFRIRLAIGITSSGLRRQPNRRGRPTQASKCAGIALRCRAATATIKGTRWLFSRERERARSRRSPGNEIRRHDMSSLRPLAPVVLALLLSPCGLRAAEDDKSPAKSVEEVTAAARKSVVVITFTGRDG